MQPLLLPLFTAHPCKPLSIPDVDHELFISCEKLCKIRLADLQPFVQFNFQSNHHRQHIHVGNNDSPQFYWEPFFIVSSEDFDAGEELSLWWRNAGCVFCSLNNYLYPVEDLNNRATENPHVARLKCFHDFPLVAEATMSYVLLLETGMECSWLMRLSTQKTNWWPRYGCEDLHRQKRPKSLKDRCAKACHV